MELLTDREKKVLDYLIKTIDRDGYAPSVRDIQHDLSIASTCTVHSTLAQLEMKGYIQKENGKSRTIRIDESIHRRRKSIDIPLVGEIRAGQPILAEQNTNGFIEFPVKPVKGMSNGDLFALRIQGSSMKDAGILDGDVVIVRKSSDAENGDIVAALLEDSATVKYFYREKDGFRLQPANKDYLPIHTKELTILGKVISLLRYM